MTRALTFQQIYGWTIEFATCFYGYPISDTPTKISSIMLCLFNL